jgi:high affinity Mn2+ porin
MPEGDPGSRSDIPTAEDAAAESWAIHGQATNVWQYHPAFHSTIPRGPQSLENGQSAAETLTVTLYGGVRPWSGGEIWLVPEIDQGNGLSNTVGIAGFPNGESYQVGTRDPYVRLPLLYLRQTIGLGGGTEKVEPDLNVLGGTQPSNRIVVTVGNFSIVDVFDTNKYAHDPRNDFLNWTIGEAGAFDYEGDAWGTTVGASVEWYQDWWTIRLGLFDETLNPNNRVTSGSLGSQTQAIGELEVRYDLLDQPGRARLLFFGTRARLANYNDAVAQAAILGQPATGDGVRRLRNKAGVVLNIEQQVLDDLGFFARASLQDGGVEAYAFTDVSQSVSAGLSLAGTRWGRPDDTVGVAGVVNLASRPLRDYLAAGGLGNVIGDGQLLNAGPEQILEAFYSLSLATGPDVHVSADYQFVRNPGYNRDRGPVSIFGARLHVQF